MKFYKEVLGFESSWTWGQPPTFGSVSWGSITVMFNLQPELAAVVERHQLWFDVDEIDDLYSRHLERGAAIESPIEDKPWGRREYTVRDPHGYHLRFAGRPSYESKGGGVFPGGVRIEVRLPSREEFAGVTEEAFGAHAGRDDSLEHSWGGIVAVDPDGNAIGVVRIVRDAPAWFSAWDVAVLPKWQGKRIGSAMMEKALEIVRAESPGAFLYLFTFKNEFYERLGFEKQTLHMRKV